MCGAEHGTGRVPDMVSTTPEPGWRYDSIPCPLGALGKEPKKPVILYTVRRVDRDKCFKFLISYEANYLAMAPYCYIGTSMFVHVYTYQYSVRCFKYSYIVV